MSDYKVGETSDLFDASTGRWVGMLDRNGKEQTIVDTVAAALGVTSGMRQAATKCKVPNYFDSTNKQAIGQRSHIAQSVLPSGQWQIAVPNFYQLVGSTGEAGSGAAMSVNAAIEYPKGTTTVVTFGGSATGSIADNTFGLSDAIPLPIPKGAKFWVRLFLQSAGGIPLSLGAEGQLDTTATGDNTQLAVSGLTNTTATPGAITNTTGAKGVGCCAIIAPNAAPSLFLWGNSLTAGIGDSGYAQASLQALESTTGAIGYPERAAARQGAYIVCGMPGELVQNIAAGGASYYANRLLLKAYCTVVHSELASNDLVAGRTAAQMIADINTLSTIVAPLPLYYSTIQPMGATSSDGFTTYAGQTVAAYNGIRTTLNDSLRDGKVSGVAGVFDAAAVLEQGKNNGKWRTFPTARILTDGVISSGTASLASATAAFTIADIGAPVYVSGAGAAGASLTSFISDVASNGASCTLANNASTTVGAGATIRIGYNAFTADGNHPYLLGPKSVEEQMTIAFSRFRL